MFFWIGWIYESKWYSFYGINIAQIEMPVQLVITQSVSPLLIIFFVLLLLFLVVYILRWLFVYLFYVFTGKEVDWAYLLSFDVVIGEILPIVFAVYSILFLWVARKLATTKLSLGIDLDMLAVIITLLNLILAVRVALRALLSLYVGVFGVFFPTLSRSVKHSLRLEWGETLGTFRDKRIQVSLVTLTILLSSVYLSGLFGIADARLGFRDFGGGNWGVQHVYISSVNPIPALKGHFLEQRDAQYLYGPLGYITENKRYLFLTDWKSDPEGYFRSSTTPYMIDFNIGNQINIIPVETEAQAQIPAPIGTTGPEGAVTATPGQP